MTKQNQLVYDIVMSSCDHPTADEVYARAKKSMQSLAFGTVYRNLAKLADEGRIRKVTVPNSAARYDKTLVQHDHIICEDCGSIIDAYGVNFENFLKKELDNDNLKYELSIYTVCDKCKGGQ